MERSLVLLSVQRGLLGMITSKMKAITVGYTDTSLTLRVYFESNPSEEELELLKEVTSEISSDIEEISQFKEEAVVTSKKANKLPELDDWVYVRYE